MRVVHQPGVLAALGKSEFELYDVVDGMTVIELLVYAMRLDRGRIVAAGNESYRGNFQW